MQITTLSQGLKALGVSRVSPTQLLRKLRGPGRCKACNGYWKYVCEKDFHPNVKAKQAVVPKNSSGFLDSSLNGSIIAPQIMSEVQSI